MSLTEARILWIAGKRAEGPSFVPVLRKKGYTVDVVNTGNQALEQMSQVIPDLVVVHAASLRTSGKRICRAIRERAAQVPIVIIVAEQGSSEDETLKSNDANVVLTLNFTPRKLLNRIMSLLPSAEEQLLEVGPLKLDVGRRRVYSTQKDARLTPRLTHLLKLLMEHPGEVMERARLFREVWKTEYTGDTRTLDVHMSWLRDAIETDARNPLWLKTIRGVGYRLDIDSEV